MGEKAVRGAVMGQTRESFPTRWLLEWAGATFLVALLASVIVARSGAPVWGDIEIARRIQAAPLLLRVAWFVNEVGGRAQWFYGPLAILVVASYRRVGGGRVGSRLRREALWAMGAVVILRPLSGILKELIASPRPAEAFGVRIQEVHGGFGFPSGHVFGDVLVLGALAVYARAVFAPRFVEPVRVSIVVLIVAAGPARVAVGAHWPSDVVGGYLWGGFALLTALVVGRIGGGRIWRRQKTSGTERSSDGIAVCAHRETSVAENGLHSESP